MEKTESNCRFAYENLLSATRDAIFIHRFCASERHGPFLEVNEAACRVLGYTREEMMGLTPWDIIAKDELQSTGERRAALARERELVHEKTLVAKSGKTIHVELNSRLFEIGEQTFALSIARDISERKQAEREKDELVQRLRQALDEVKTLRGILPTCMFCKKIRREGRPDDKQDSWVPLEQYLMENSEAMVSHGLCPDCLQKEYPEHA